MKGIGRAFGQAPVPGSHVGPTDTTE